MRQRATGSKAFRDSTRALTSAWVDANSLSSYLVTILFRQCFIHSIWPAIAVSSLANVQRIADQIVDASQHTKDRQEHGTHTAVG